MPRMYPVGFNPNLVQPALIAEAMRPALYAWFNARILIVDPNTRFGSAYDAKTDTGGPLTPTTLFDSGPNGALVQPIRAPRTVDSGDQNVALIGIRFQVKIEAIEVQLHSGLQVVVVDAGNDLQIGEFTYVLKQPMNSSLAWGKILEATVLAGGRA